MFLFQLKKEVQSYLSETSGDHSHLALVPTMGALHHGHLSLVRKALEENDCVVVSIFINPTQFDNPDDLKKYPSTLDQDLDILRPLSENLVVFAPTVSEIYPDGLSANTYDFGGLEHVMEGIFRQNHFNGVATVVEELFTIIKPNRAYFGEKDFQQLAIIKRLVLKRHLDTEVIGCPIVREDNGLAMSSRNNRLSANNRARAGFIYETLKTAKVLFGTKNAIFIKEWVVSAFEENPEFSLEYFEILDEETLRPSQTIRKEKAYRAFVAVYLQEVRLIDNIALN